VQLATELINRFSSTAPQTQCKLLVVNDGSRSPAAIEAFAALEKFPQLSIVTHAENRGKGAALKTAFALILEKMPEIDLVVTADADGQHHPDDILNVAAVCAAQNSPVLGVRIFDENVPARSRIGNELTRKLFRLFFGIDVRDTQTGLRGLPRRELPGLLSIGADRYNFEFEALIKLVKQGTLVQHPIRTIYEPGNPTSHFNPILDSARIYAVFGRHVSAVVAIGILDWLMFTVFSAAGYSILRSLILARVISTLVYFAAARSFVYRSKGRISVQLTAFLLLVCGNIALLWPFITVAHETFGVPKTLAMFLASAFLFISNFLWQNYIIFRRNETEQ
jgi:glycosyltransferase involved in cell wall biosynthesis